MGKERKKVGFAWVKQTGLLETFVYFLLLRHFRGRRAPLPTTSPGTKL